MSIGTLAKTINNLFAKRCIEYRYCERFLIVQKGSLQTLRKTVRHDHRAIEGFPNRCFRRLSLNGLDKAVVLGFPSRCHGGVFQCDGI
jgi:hypothetical protein